MWVSKLPMFNRVVGTTFAKTVNTLFVYISVRV